MIPVGTSGASYCCLAFSRPLISQPGRNAAEKPRWMLKGTVAAGHRIGKGYRQRLAVPPQGLAGCLLLPQDPYSVHTVGMAKSLGAAKWISVEVAFMLLAVKFQ